MSMIGHYLRLPEAELNRFLLQPASLSELLLSRLSQPSGDCFDIEKAWHIIHFLLTGERSNGPEPLVNAVLGGTPIGEELSYGPARYLTPAQVAALAAALGPISPEELLGRFDLQAVKNARIYPSGWILNDLVRDFVIHHFQRLKEFFETAAGQKEAVILYIS